MEANNTKDSKMSFNSLLRPFRLKSFKQSNNQEYLSKSSSNIESNSSNGHKSDDLTNKKLRIHTITYDQMMEKLIRIANSNKSDNIELKHYSRKIDLTPDLKPYEDLSSIKTELSKGQNLDSAKKQSENLIKNKVKFNSTSAIHSIEEEILQSLSPIQTNETEEIEVLGYKGVLLNKNEILNFGGDYKLNNDPNPEIVYKQSNQPIEYEQDIQIRYLKPPTPPPPGDLIIKEEINESNSKPPPPLVIRQQSLLSSSNIQEPIYIREIPPEPPSPVPTQVITIKPKHHHEQSRKVIVERLPPTPRPIVIEKWFL